MPFEAWARGEDVGDVEGLEAACRESLRIPSV
jgi:hypothetical protein